MQGGRQPTLGSTLGVGGDSLFKCRPRTHTTHTSPVYASKLLSATFFSSEEWSKKCCGFIGKSAKFCIEEKVATFGHCGTTSHGRRKFSPDYNRYYAPVGMHYGTPAADSEMNIHVNRLSGKWRDKVRKGLFIRTQWADIFIKVMTEDLHRSLDEANEEDEREQRKVGRKQEGDQALETALQTGGRALQTGERSNTVGVTTMASPFNANTPLDANTAPYHHMFQKMCNLEAKVEVLLERTSSNV